MEVRRAPAAHRTAPPGGRADAPVLAPLRPARRPHASTAKGLPKGMQVGSVRVRNGPETMRADAYEQQPCDRCELIEI